ncbi:MAG: MaoC family dehydratase N-terminal domain-containing protein [Actinomycetota bacterium]|nr:MaoC family dehydratase N-terminal domain-containing protein [Actinomycetota bacterium]
MDLTTSGGHVVDGTGQAAYAADDRVSVDRFPVEASHVMMFARAIGDPNPAYLEADEHGAILAPPTFVQASAQFDPDYGLRPTIGEPWFGSGREATGVPPAPGERTAGGLHAEQHYEYHRPVRVGDVLRVQARPGRSWDKEGRRGGTLSFSETITEYRTLDSELVVTARSVRVVTGSMPPSVSEPSSVSRPTSVSTPMVPE